MSATDPSSIEHRLDDHALGSLLAALPTAFFVSSRETGRILFANAAATAISGVPTSELLGRSAVEFYADPADRARVVDLLRRDGQVVEFETRMLDPQGQPFWTALSGRILPRPAGDLVVTAWRSIAVRKAAQERVDSLLATVESQNAELELRVAERTRELAAARDELARSRQQLLEALEAMSEGFVLWDADDRFVLCNSRYRTQFSSSPELLTPGTPFEAVLRHDIAKGNKPDGHDVEDWIRTRTAQHRDPVDAFTVKLPGGRHVRIIERKTREGGVVAIRTDVSALINQQEDLAASQRLMRAVIDAVPAIINVKDDHSRYVLMNRFQGEMYGVEPDQALGKRSADFVGERYGRASDDLDRTVVASGKPLPFAERAFVDAHGRPHTWLSAKLPLHDPETGDVRNVVTVALDVSILKETERARANLSRYFAPNLVDMLSTNDQPFGPTRASQVAVLFADIVGFTRLCSEDEPEDVFALLRAFQDRMADCIFACDGTLDKYIGDSVMATFGTPEGKPDDATRAVRCAHAMLASVDAFNEDQRDHGKRTIQVAIGAHYGTAFLGHVGSARRLEFTVIGDTVNVASRLEKMTRQLDVRLVTSQALVERVAAESGADTFELDGLVDLGVQPIRGRTATVRVWGAGQTISKARVAVGSSA